MKEVVSAPVLISPITNAIFLVMCSLMSWLGFSELLLNKSLYGNIAALFLLCISMIGGFAHLHQLIFPQEISLDAHCLYVSTHFHPGKEIKIFRSEILHVEYSKSVIRLTFKSKTAVGTTLSFVANHDVDRILESLKSSQTANMLNGEI